MNWKPASSILQHVQRTPASRAPGKLPPNTALQRVKVEGMWKVLNSLNSLSITARPVRIAISGWVHSAAWCTGSQNGHSHGVKACMLT